MLDPDPYPDSMNPDPQHYLKETRPTLQKDGVLAGRRPERQLVEGDDLAARLQDTLASLLSHAQRAESHLGNLKDPTQVEVKIVQKIVILGTSKILRHTNRS
jgi:hypothetical protein